MLSISSATQKYFEREFASKQEKYLSSSASGEIDRNVTGEFGRRFGLKGQITKEQYERLCNGQHPKTGKQLIEHSTQQEYVNEKGETVKPAKHRPGWDVTFSAPKSVSVGALVGKDNRLLEAHREAVQETLREVERFAQAKKGNLNPPELTRNLIMIQFEHDSARPVNNYAAPQLHTHNFVMNMTQDKKGQVRALETHEIFRAQHYLTTFYRARLAEKILSQGFEIDQRRDGSFDIKGFSEEFLQANSPRSRQRDERLKEKGLKYSAKAAEVAVLDTRQKKVDVTEPEIRTMWEAVDAQHGCQTQQVISQAIRRGNILKADTHLERTERVREAVTHAIAMVTEREAVFDETKVITASLKYDIGRLTPNEIKLEVARRMETGELLHVAHRRSQTPQAALTTPEMLKMEEDNIKTMKDGKGMYDPVADKVGIERAIKKNELETGLALNQAQRKAVETVLTTRDQILGIQGRAGVGKTTVLQIIRAVSEAQGYEMVGFAPSGQAANLLAESGIRASTLQSFTSRPGTGKQQHPGKQFYVIDEASQASTKEMRRFFDRLGPKDRVLLVGDFKQHVAVEAGSPFHQLQTEGMNTPIIDQIVRQRNPELRRVVQALSEGNMEQGLQWLGAITYRTPQGVERTGIIQEQDREKRLGMMVKDYAEAPDRTLCVAPDNRTRAEINEMIHRELQVQGQIGREDHAFRVLVPLRDLTAAERKRAGSYEVGDRVRYVEASERFQRGEYAHVVERNRGTNRITVEKESGEQVIYNPKRLSGVELYREEDRKFATGEQVQFTRQDKERGIANREHGIITEIDGDTVKLKLGSRGNQEVGFNVYEFRHVDYGYALTSYSSQGQTTERVLVHADTGQAATLVDERMAYVATSRATHEARWYTDNTQEMIDLTHRCWAKLNAVEEKHKKGMRRSLAKEAVVETQAQQPKIEQSPETAITQQKKAPAHAPSIEQTALQKEELPEVMAQSIGKRSAMDATDLERHREASLFSKRTLERKDLHELHQDISQSQTPTQEHHLGVTPPTQLQAVEPRRVDQIDIPKPNLEQWIEARRALGNLKQWDPVFMEALDRGYQQGRVFADAHGNAWKINGHGQATCFLRQEKETRDYTIDPDQAKSIIQHASMVNQKHELSWYGREVMMIDGLNLREVETKHGLDHSRSNAEFERLFGEKWTKNQNYCLNLAHEAREDHEVGFDQTPRMFQEVGKPIARQEPRYEYDYGLSL